MCKRWIDSSGQIVSWVVLAGDIPGVDGALPSVEDGVDTPKDDVRLLVLTASFPPSFDDSFVVPINLEVSAAAAG